MDDIRIQRTTYNLSLAVKSIYDVIAEFNLSQKTKDRKRYIVQLNTELYFLNDWFLRSICILRNCLPQNNYNDRIDDTLYANVDWNLFSDTPYVDPQYGPGPTLDHQLRFINESFVELLLKIENTPPIIQNDPTYDYIITNNIIYLHKYLELREKYQKYLRGIRMFSLIRNTTIEVVVDKYRQHGEPNRSIYDNTVIQNTVTLASNPLRRSLEYIYVDR